jgi:hypothetical protein
MTVHAGRSAPLAVEEDFPSKAPQKEKNERDKGQDHFSQLEK